MLFGEVIDDCSENHAQHTLFGQNEKFLCFFKVCSFKDAVSWQDYVDGRR